MWIGFDLGGTKMLAVAYDADFQVVARERRKTSESAGAANVERLIETVHLCVAAARKESPGFELRGIGLGCPGPIDVMRGVLIAAPNLGWKDLALQDRLHQEFACAVSLVNDVDAGLFGEARRGAAQGSHSTLGVFPGTGIGGAFIENGRIYTGARRTAVEIGHLPVQTDGPLCGCGRRGCLEAIASRLAIAAAAAQAAYRGDAPYLAGHFGTDLRKIRSRALRESIENGDQVVEDIVRHAARTVGRSIGGVINLLAPDRVVLGGGLVEALPELYLGEVRSGAEGQVMSSYAGTYEVVIAQLGDDAAVLGAAAWVKERSE